MHRFDRPNEAGFHGIFYVGPVTASLPAVRRGLGRPGARDNSFQPLVGQGGSLASRW